MKKINLAIVGATGAVGSEVFRVLEEFDLSQYIKNIYPFSSERSAGKTILFNTKSLTSIELKEDSFKEYKIDVAIFSAGGSISSKFVPFATKYGTVVIDNTNYFRMDENIPLIVPEVNPEKILDYKKTNIIANPNCSTIQMVQVLKPLDDLLKIERVDVSTYQSVSGAGNKATEELFSQMQDVFSLKGNDDFKQSVFPHKIALNCFPQIDDFLDNAYTKEEMKMVQETSKILGREIPLNATCVRVPVVSCHSEALSIKFENKFNINDIYRVLDKAENVEVFDDINHLEYPMPLICAGKNETFVGRIRQDLFDKSILHLWVVADNLRVGAATNAIRILKKLIGQL
jgi:aspartate-semialdehyde dehydrogenase